ncbi:MAG TPA: formate--tetrahydrofolate ligase [Candidatus Sumerlaeota bacterium]|nr:formate--tetrahydrofolate ligase [Candidatus Sumerlaeota bacterium]
MSVSSPSRSYRQLPAVPPDIEVARAARLKPITEVAATIGIPEDELELYGRYKGKVSERTFRRVANHPDGKLVLVTAMTATPAGEGKTVTCIGLAQALGKRGVKHMLVLREPSLGPTFGIKGGAAGGGHAQVLPMEDINMHFTGDLHAITSAHNLLAAVMDNHIYQGNELNIDPEKVIWRRVMDLCDRQLRHCEVGLGTKFDGFPHKSGFDITASSEVMAIMALASDLNDLRARLERIVVAYTHDDQPVYAGQLGVVGSMVVLLKDALQPNLVQTSENTPALIHCGPFANIAHGCNSLRATQLGLKLADVVVTEAGFAADLGAEKFLDIKCRLGGLKPDATVLVVTCRALKMHGGVPKEDINKENVAALREGLANVRVHLENLKKFNLPIVVAINRFPSDTPAEMDAVHAFCEEMGATAALSEVAALGGEGGLELADAVLNVLREKPAGIGEFKFLYDENLPIKQKIETIATEIYRADGVDYEPAAEASIARLEKLGFGQKPVCMAKTQLSISDDPKKMGAPTGWRLTVRDIKVSNGAGFLVAITGKLMLMPGMPKKPATENIGIDENGNVYGLS